MVGDDERLALFLDFENLAIGMRESLGDRPFDFRPIADALAERGRVVVRRAYADWTLFPDDRRTLTRHQVELIEMPQSMGVSRKNAADIKMAVDALELCFEREYVTTFVLATGDSDFTPLVHKLRELNRRVIGVGMEPSTSALLAAACDEFLFYERLEGVEPAPGRRGARMPGRRAPALAARAVAAAPGDEDLGSGRVEPPEERDVARLVVQTLAGLERGSAGPVFASVLKRAILRKEPTFDEADLGFRGFGELLRHLADQGVVELAEGAARGDPEVAIRRDSASEEAAFELLHDVVARVAEQRGGVVPLSGLKDRLRREQPDFDEQRLGYGSFLQFCKAARARDLIELQFDAETGGYLVGPVAP